MFGTMVQHSGGYPGFGSQMRWHPATRTGVIVLGNGTYANVGSLALAILSDVLTQLAAACGGALVRRAGAAGARAGRGPERRRPGGRGPAPGDGGPWPETLTAREEVDRLLAHWDGELAARLFTPNVDWDQPLDSRREAVARIRERIGDFAPDPARPPEFDSPSHCRWWLTGDRGTVQAEIGLAPLQAPLVQSLRVAVPPAPGSVLARMLGTLVGIINDAPASWPAWLPAAADVDTAQLARRLRLVTAWAGRCAAGAYRSGDGESAVDRRAGRRVRPGRARGRGRPRHRGAAPGHGHPAALSRGRPGRPSGRPEDGERRTRAIGSRGASPSPQALLERVLDLLARALVD